MSTVNVNSLLTERPTVYGNTVGYSVAEVFIPNAANSAGGGAGDTVTVSFVFSQGNLPSDTNYCIQATANQACAISYASKTATGFNVVLTPLASGDTLSAGTIDVIVSWDIGA